MTSFNSNNAQYYLLVGLLKDHADFSLDRSLERDMIALTSEPPTNRWSVTGDVNRLAGLIIRAFELADVECVIGQPSDDQIDKVQAVKDLFALHKAVKEFLSITWRSEPAQQQEIATLVEKTQVAAAHSRGVLARRKYAGI